MDFFFARLMCSILLVLSLCIVIFTLISDYNRFCIGTLDLQIALEQHGFANQKTGRQTCTGPSQIRLVPSQTWLSDPVKPTFETNPPSAAKTSFQGSSIPCKDHRRDERRMLPYHGSASHASAFAVGNTSTVQGAGQSWRMTMDTNFVPQVRPTTPRRVQWNQDQWSEQSHWEQAQWIKSPRRRQSPRQRSKKGPQGPHAKGKGKQKQADDQVQYGPQSLPAMPSLEPPWMTSLNSSAQHVLGSFSIPDVRGQRRQGQGEADAIFGCSTQEAPRRSARGCPSLDEGRLHPSWPARNQTAPCGSVTTRQGQAGDSRRTGCEAEHACGLEELLVTISSAMDCVYKPVHVPGETTHGQIKSRPGKSDHCKGEPQQFPISRWSGPERRCGHDQRYRGHPRKGARVGCWRENRGELSGLGQQSAGPSHSSSPSCATRSGSAGPASQKTQSRLTAQQGKRQRDAAQPRFWRGRVNTPTACIAHWPPLQHWGLKSRHRNHAATASFAPNFDHGPNSLYSNYPDQIRSYSDSDFSTKGHPVPCVPQGSDLLVHSNADVASHVQGFNFSIQSYPLDQADNFWQTIKWQHTVLTETDFIDEWSAQDNAFHLAAEVNVSNPQFAPFAKNVICYVPRTSRPKSRVASVSFDEEIELLIGLDEDQAFHAITIPSQSLTMPNKPWSILSPTDSDKSLTQPVDPCEPKSTGASHNAGCHLNQVDPCRSQSLPLPIPVDPRLDAGLCEVQIDASVADSIDPGRFCLSLETKVEFGQHFPPPRRRAQLVSFRIVINLWSLCSD